VNHGSANAWPCPTCKTATAVIDSRGQKDRTVKRKRRCLNATCGYQVTTIEIDAKRLVPQKAGT